MKVAFVSEHLTGQGSEFATAIIARAFAKKGWDVDILVSQVHTDYLRQGRKAFELPSSVKIVNMPNRRGSRNGFYMRWYLKHGGANLIIAESNIYSWCIVWASLGLAKRNLPKLAQVNHGDTYLLSGFKLFVEKIKYWYHYKKFSSLMFVNQVSTSNFKKMFGFLKGLQVGTVNNACVDDVFLEKVKLPPTHPWLVDKKFPTFVTAGAYEPYKDHMTLLKAMKIVKEKDHNIRVIIFGRGHLESVYKDFIAENGLENMVSVGGFTDRLPAEIKASDGFVLSSNWESFGIVLGEALACKVPCIATDAPYGPREILLDGKYGRLIPVADPHAMASAIIDGANGQIPVAPDESWKRYTIEAIETRYFECLDCK